MNRSDSIETLAPCWVAALNELHHVGKDTIGHYGSYASLGNVLDTTKPVLAEHGLAIQQYNAICDPGQVRIVTRLWHESGEWIEDYGQVMPTPNDPQKVGGAVSYARRYALLTFMGLATGDDDGQTASDAIAKENEPHPLSERVTNVQGELRSLSTDEQSAVKDWAGDRSLAAPAMLDDEEWLNHVETWLDEMGNR